MSSLSLDVLSDTVWFELGRQLGLKLECCIWACLGVSGQGLSELRNLAAKCLAWGCPVCAGVSGFRLSGLSGQIQSDSECLARGCDHAASSSVSVRGLN